jgi:hypothetical protein
MKQEEERDKDEFYIQVDERHTKIFLIIALAIGITFIENTIKMLSKYPTIFPYFDATVPFCDDDNN